MNKTAIAQIIFGSKSDKLIQSINTSTPVKQHLVPIDLSSNKSSSKTISNTPSKQSKTPINNTTNNTSSNVEIIEYDKSVRHSGEIKFYDEKKKFGFILRKGNTDLFVYEDALIEAGLTLDQLRECKTRRIQVGYCSYRYRGTDGSERTKAVDLAVLHTSDQRTHTNSNTGNRSSTSSFNYNNYNHDKYKY